MRSRKFTWFLLILLMSVFAVSSLLFADIYVEQQMKTSAMMGKPGRTTTQRIWITKDMMRSEDVGSKQVMIVRLDKNLIWMIDLERKTYRELTIDEFKQMMGMARAMMRGEKAEVELTETGKKMKIKGWNCYEVRLTMKGGTNMETSMWLTKDIAIPWEEYQKYMELFGGQFYGPKVMEKWKNLRGYPIRSHGKMNMMGMEMETETEVMTVRTTPIPKSVFELPPGLTKEEASVPKMPH